LHVVAPRPQPSCSTHVFFARQTALSHLPHITPLPAAARTAIGTGMKRILIYSHDTFGLGNIRRMLEVARHLVQSSPEVSVLVITGSPMLHAFRIPPGIDYVKLPCLSRNVEGHYGARSLAMSLAGTVRLRANLIRSAIADFEPDLILVDKKPFGVEDELAGALEALPSAPKRPKLVLLLRDILDSPESTARVWRKNGYFEAITAYYHQVLVVGCPEVFDLRREYGFPPFAAAKVEFCGYIAREAGRRTREQTRSDLGIAAGEPLVLITPGGGEDGYGLVSAALRAWAERPAATRPRAHIVCGPEMSEAQRAAVAQAATALPGVSVQDFSDDMMSLMAAADVVVAMGGYNTVCELLTLRKRAVLVPRMQPGVEQCVRAERMAAMGLLRMVHPQRLDSATLMAAIDAELAGWRRREQRPLLRRLDGLERVTAALFEAIGLRIGGPVRPGAASHNEPIREPEWSRRTAAAPSAC
jgi:predicted glycosyltransferase